MNNKAPLSVFLIIVGSFQLLKKKSYAVILACLTFSMMSALTWATVSRVADRVEVHFAEQLSMSQEDVSTEISTQLLTLSELPLHEYVSRVSGDGRMQITSPLPLLTKEQLGLAFAVQVGPYLIAQLFIHIFRSNHRVGK